MVALVLLLTKRINTLWVVGGAAALSFGATPVREPKTESWGDRVGGITDPFGHRWGLAQHLEDVAPEEMKKRSEAFTAKMSKAAGK